MKILNYCGEQYKGSKVLKSDNTITVIDENGIEVFIAKGISDFSGFSVTNSDGSTTTFDDLITAEKNHADIAYMALMLGVSL